MHCLRTLSAAAAIALMAGTASAQSIGIGTGPQASLTNRIGSAVAKVLADGAGLKTRAIPHTSGSAQVPLIDRGSLEFGINSTQQISAGVGGTDQFKGRATKNWVMAARLVPLPVGMLVRKDSPYYALSDLKGKTITVGYTAQKTVLFVLNGFLGNAGMTLDQFKGVPVPNTTAGAQLFLKGKVDSSLSSLGGARLRRAAAKVGGIRILGMNNTPKAVAGMRKGYPNSYLVQLKPGKRSIGVEKPIWVMAFDMVLTTSTKVSDEIVYKSVKALHGGKAAMVKISGVFHGFNPKNMVPHYKGVKIHPGAMKFYKETGQ